MEGRGWCKKDEEGDDNDEASSLSDGMDHFFSLQLESQQFLSLYSHNSSFSPPRKQ